MLSFKFQFLSLIALLFGVAVFASPAPAPIVDSAEVEAAVTALLENRQGALSGLLGSLTGLLPALLKLVNAQFLNNVGTLVNNAAYLLDATSTNQTKFLIATAAGLLADLGPLLDGLSGLLSPELISKLGGLLDAVFGLLTPEFIAQISGLIADVAPLISAVAQLISGLISAVLG